MWEGNCAVRLTSSLKVGHRVQTAWARFHAHRDMLMDTQLNIYSPSKVFNTRVAPTILFCLASCAMARSYLSSSDVFQRRMLRSI
eukprot:2316794-Pyramimonas_sp.AAC.1